MSLLKKTSKREIVEKKGFNPFLLSKIQPQGNLKLDDERYIKTGDGFSSCIEVYEYPSQVFDFWLSSLMNRDDVIAMMDIATADNEEAEKNITNSMTELDVRFAHAKNESEKIEAEHEYSVLKNLLTSLKTEGEVIKNIRCRLYVSARTREEVDEKIKIIIKSLEATDFNAAVYLNETEYQYKAMFTPYGRQLKAPSKRIGNPLPALSLAGGYCFNNEHLDDDRGMYIGVTQTGGNVNFDLFHKSKSRLSYDALVIGKKGSGKSTTLKLLLKNNAIVGNYARVIDVAGEFTDLALELGGKIITLDGKQGIINYLEVFKTDEDENISFSRHLSKLNTFYRFLSPDSGADERNEFEEYVRHLYEASGLWEIGKEGQKVTGLAPNVYPIFSDLLEAVRKDLYDDVETKTVNQRISESRLKRLESIELTINNIISSYGNMFNGHTTVPNLSSEQIIVYNVQNISNMKSEVFNSMLFNVLSLMLDDMINIGLPSKQMYESGVDTENIPKLLLIIDEAHKIISTKNPLALDHMIEIVREGRKFYTGLVFASQSIRDYAPENADSEVVERIKTLFELTQYKFIMQQDPNSLNLMRNIFEGELTESQLQQIPKFQQAECVLSITGQETLNMRIEITEEEKKLFKGGA